MSMEESFQKYLDENPSIQLIPKGEVSTIKIKLGKSHRKEADWIVIKDILYTHDLITAAPQNATSFVGDIEGVLCEEDVLIAFTNFDDCECHLKDMYKRDSWIGSQFRIKSFAFTDILELADRKRMDLFIDVQDETGKMFMAYSHETKEIRAMMLSL